MTELLQVQNLSFSYGGRPVLEDLSCSIGRGEMVSVVGRNGCGKSTLLSLLWGTLHPNRGQVLLEGRPVERFAARELARRVAVIAQREEQRFPYLCREWVQMGLAPRQSRFSPLGEEERGLVQSVMEEIGVLPLADQPVTQLSGGEYQRVLLARALVQRPELLLLDEAMADLDVAARMEMNRLLLRRVEQGLTVVAINHDLPTAYRFSSRILALNQGHLVADGPPQRVFTPEFLATVFGVKGEVLGEKGLSLYDTINAPDKR